MCFGIIKHFYYFELDILCFLELKADYNNLCTVAFSNHTNNSLHWTDLGSNTKVFVFKSI